MVLDADPSTGSHAIYQWTLHGNDNQKWKISPALDQYGYPDGNYYTIKNKTTGSVIDADPSTGSHAIYQWTLHGNDNQKWSFEAVPDGFKIRNKLNNNVLDASSSHTVYQWSAHGGDNQVWQLSATN